MAKVNLVVRALNRRAKIGIATIGNVSFPCALGRGGLAMFKREGDGRTPIGRWIVRRILFRPDRARQFMSVGLFGHATPIRQSDGWCDAIGDRNYNRLVQHPYPVSAEKLWRTDSRYDVIVVLGHNDRPRVQGLGSAIFLHLASLDCSGGVPANRRLCGFTTAGSGDYPYATSCWLQRQDLRVNRVGRPPLPERYLVFESGPLCS